MRNDEKIHELNVWFDYYFAKQLQQSQWQKDFRVSPDEYFKDENGNPKTYENLEALFEQAQFVREEIKRLKKL